MAYDDEKPYDYSHQNPHDNIDKKIYTDSINTKPYIDVDYFADLTCHIKEPEKTCAKKTGVRMKKAREEKGLSFKQLSDLTGLDEQFLKDVEANRAQPQLGAIIKISRALDSAFGGLVSGKGNKTYCITKRDDKKPILSSDSSKYRRKLYTYKCLAADVQGRGMEPMIVQLEENHNEEPESHGGEEFIYVLKGVAMLKIGDEQLELEAGDSAYYLSTVPHILSAKKGKAVILAVIYGG